MKPFEYVRPKSVAEAIKAASTPGSAYLAAGTNLLDMMKIGVARPDRIVDITHLQGLDSIEWTPDGGVRIGALVRNADLAYDARFAATFPSISEAMLSGASPQLRNAATIGGNLMQRTRCAYFADTASACNRREPGTGCDAIGGENRLHAILGWSDACIATHPSDLCVPLIAFDARVEIEGPNGAREIALDDLHLLPGSTPQTESALQPGELITALKLPASAAAFSRNTRYIKVRERTSYAFAVVACAAALTLDGSKISEARIALGGVAAKPWRVRGAEALLSGAIAGPESFARAADAALTGARPSGDNAFKIELARRLVVRALEAAQTGTPSEAAALPASPFSSRPGASHHV